MADAPQMQIAYYNLRYTVKVKAQGGGWFNSSVENKDVLKQISGTILPSRLTAVMGASGAGKTTMLNVLVARALEVAEILGLTGSLDSLVGSSMVKGISGGEKRRLSVGMEMITNPSILFLDEPTSGLDTFNAYRVISILHQLAHKYTRTVVATIHQPSSEIFQMFDDLVVLAAGKVLFHSTCNSMVQYFDRLGYVCPTYTNPADFLFMDVLNAGGKEEATNGMVLVLPLSAKNINNSLSIEGDAMDRMENQSKGSPRKQLEESRIQALLDAWPRSVEGQQMQQAVDDIRKNVARGIDEAAVLSFPPFLRQYALLAQRSWANSWRNSLIIKGKLGQTLFLSILIGLIYLQIDNDQRGVQDRQGSLFFLAVQGLFGSVMGVMTVFGTEKAVFQREYGGRMYGLPAYFLSRTMVDLPVRIVMPIMSAAITYWMIGYQADAAKFCWYALIFVLLDNAGAGLGILVACIFNDLAVALSVVPMFLLPLMVFSGFFVNADNIGPWFIWISYISPIRYGFTAIALNEFGGLEIDCKPDQDCPANYDGEAVIRQLGFANERGIEFQAGMLAVLIGGYLTIAYLALANAVRRSST